MIHLAPLRLLEPEPKVTHSDRFQANGHIHICFLTGAVPKGHPATRLATYITAIDTLGLDEIILNIDPKTVEDFVVLRKAVKETPLQFRAFQETYDRKSYARAHPRSKKGLKHDCDFRRGSQFRALGAGFDNVGIGALLGLHRYRIETLYALAKLALPYVNLVSSERDPKGLLEVLGKYSSCTTLNVHPGVGDNLKHHVGTENAEVHDPVHRPDG